MKSFFRMMTIGLFTVSIAVFISSNAFAIKAQAENPHDGSPPYGVAVSTDAKGTKLSGVISVEYYDISEVEVQDGGLVYYIYPAKVNAVLRLRQGNELHTFFKSFEITDMKDIPGTQWEIMSEMAASGPGNYTGVLETFFGSEEHTFSIKALEEYDEVLPCENSGTCLGDDTDSLYYLMDVIVAVQ